MTINAAKATTLTAAVSGGATINAATAVTSAATITATAVDDSGVTITTGTGAATTTTIAIDLDGTTGTSDVATIAGAGVITVDIDKTSANSGVDILNLSGTTAAVTYTVKSTQATGALTSIVASGAQTVNVKTSDALVDAKTVTGVNTLTLTSADGTATDLSKVSATTIELNADFAGQAITAKNASTFVLTADQTTELDIRAKADGDTVTIKAGDDNGTSTATPDLVVTTLNLASGNKFATVTLDSTDGKITAATSTLAATTTNIVVVGANDVNLGAVTAKSVDASALTGKLTATMAANLATLTAGSGIDTLTLNDGSTVHTLVAGAGNDILTVTATAATTTIDAGAGNDALSIISDADAIVVSMGDGDDTVSIGDATNTNLTDAIYVGGNGSDTFTVDSNSAAVDLSAKTNFAITGFEVLNLTNLDNTLTLSAAQFANNSTVALKGTGTNDILLIKAAATGSVINTSNVTLASSSDDVTLSIIGGAKNDTITGGAMNEIITLSGGADTIDGGAGTDTVYLSGKLGVTETGSDISTGVVANFSTSAVSAVTILGAVSLYTGNSSDAAAGTVSYLFDANKTTNSVLADTVQNIEKVIGTTGKDYIKLSSAGMTVDGGAGADTIVLGSGADTVVLSGTSGGDTISGFTHASDVVQLGGTTAAVGVAVAGVAGDAAHTVVFDTIANLGALGITIGDQTALTNDIHYAVASDTGAVFYDADGNWSAGSVQIATLGVVSGLTIADFLTA